ncbi:MAG TPA: SH3 domain-containing protein [Rhizomicrobium sp.]|nr:SH3 domain-containing protein [Rhizomicrobium sp.]
MRRIAAALLLAMLTPASAAEFAVTGVADDDSLNLRAAPDAKAARVGTLASHATGIAITETNANGWVKVSKGGQSGWVNAKFLAYDNGLPVALTCSGTEPFWSIRIGYGGADADFSAMDAGRTRITLAPPVAAQGRPHPWLYSGADKGASFIVIDKATCSDGMSDTSYPYAITASVGGHFVEGCCK